MNVLECHAFSERQFFRAGDQNKRCVSDHSCPSQVIYNFFEDTVRTAAQQGVSVTVTVVITIPVSRLSRVYQTTHLKYMCFQIDPVVFLCCGAIPTLFSCTILFYIWNYWFFWICVTRQISGTTSDFGYSSGVNMWEHIIRTLIVALLNSSQRSQVGVWMYISAGGWQSKLQWTGYRSI